MIYYSYPVGFGAPPHFLVSEVSRALITKITNVTDLSELNAERRVLTNDVVQLFRPVAPPLANQRPVAGAVYLNEVEEQDLIFDDDDSDLILYEERMYDDSDPMVDDEAALLADPRGDDELIYLHRTRASHAALDERLERELLRDDVDQRPSSSAPSGVERSVSRQASTSEHLAPPPANSPELVARKRPRVASGADGEHDDGRGEVDNASKRARYEQRR